MSKIESEFGQHEDGLTPIGEHSDEEARVGATKKRGPGKHVMIPETIPSGDLSPLDRLIAKEEGKLEEGGAVSNTDLLEEEPFAAIEGQVEPAPLDERATKQIDETKIVHGGREPIDQGLGYYESRRGRRGSQKPRGKNVGRASIKHKKAMI